MSQGSKVKKCTVFIDPQLKKTLCSIGATQRWDKPGLHAATEWVKVITWFCAAGNCWAFTASFLKSMNQKETLPQPLRRFWKRFIIGPEENKDLDEALANASRVEIRLDHPGRTDVIRVSTTFFSKGKTVVGSVPQGGAWFLIEGEPEQDPPR